MNSNAGAAALSEAPPFFFVVEFFFWVLGECSQGLGLFWVSGLLGFGGLCVCVCASPCCSRGVGLFQGLIIMGFHMLKRVCFVG